MRFERALVWTKPSYLGDAVMATPMLDALAHSCRSRSVLAAPAVRELLQDRDALQFVESGRETGFWGPVRMAMWLRRERPDAVFLLNRSFRSALGAFLGGVPVRVGHTTESRARLLTHPVEYGAHDPEIDCGLGLLRAVGISAESTRPRLGLSDCERELGKKLLAGATVGVQPGARYPEKALPLPISCELVRRLHEAGHQVALVGGSDERESSEAVARVSGVPLVNLVGLMGLRESMGAAAGLRLLVGADTGFLHVAAAVGCPTVTVFGPNSAKKWGHHYEPHSVLEAPSGEMSRLDPELLVEACERSLVRARL